jgi:putative restriction endonuclease
MDDLDREFRLAVFAHVGRLREAGGGVVTAAQLNEGLIFRGQRAPIWNQQKGIFKPALLGRDGAALTIQTSFESPYDDGADPTSGRITYRYRGTDPDHLDNKALRQAYRLGRPLVYLVGVQPGVYDAIFPFYVVGDRPQDLTFELMADMPGDLDRSFDRPLLENEALKEYATRTVRQRLHQQRFRHLVLKAYREQCAMCHLRHTSLLDAAHILPDRDDRSKPEVPNGLSLCKIHHSAYDVGIVGVDPDYRIHLRHDVLDEVDGPMLRHGLQELHGSPISIPRRSDHRPNKEYLAERFDRFRAA